jgi:hypothetical protein
MENREVVMEKPRKRGRPRKNKAEPVHRAPQINWARVDDSVRSSGSWPEDEPLPDAYRKPSAHPCPKCRAVLIDGRQAVVLASVGKVRDPEDETGQRVVDRAYFRCRCGHCFSLPVKRR